VTASPRAPQPQPLPGPLPGAYTFHTHCPGKSTLPPWACGSPCGQGRPTCGRRGENDLSGCGYDRGPALADRQPALWRTARPCGRAEAEN